MKFELEFVQMPLAVYREVAAHIRQVDRVDAGLLPQTATTFDYAQSQIGGLWITGETDLTSPSWQRVKQILTYYKSRYPLQDETILSQIGSAQ